ncbi:esterase/lipase family protein [Senegalia sp. (in: firmicutes)]|uniref:esterase/lipase family protein n=1 Tax=Senegalia sp. (in: firmicutes) TaxID=1924098 RepID=UPI003F9ABABF
MSSKKVVLVHGYFRTYRDMKILKKYLMELGYKVVRANLPLTFYEIDKGVEEFSDLIKDIIKNLGKDEKISLVGHSTGGLVIRKFILDNRNLIKYIENCVLIATPNKGNEIAEFVVENFKIFPEIFKTIKSLHPEKVKTIKPLDSTPIKIGAIAGNEESIILRPFFDCENDGKVSVDSVKYEDIDDFIILPYNHYEIHKRKETAKYVAKFIETGKFRV